jgi:hypothetical protein
LPFALLLDGVTASASAASASFVLSELPSLSLDIQSLEVYGFGRGRAPNAGCSLRVSNRTNKAIWAVRTQHSRRARRSAAQRKKERKRGWRLRGWVAASLAGVGGRSVADPIASAARLAAAASESSFCVLC